MIEELTKFEKWATENKNVVEKDRRAPYLQVCFILMGFLSIFPIIIFILPLLQEENFPDWFIPIIYILILIGALFLVRKFASKLTTGQKLAILLYRIYLYVDMQGINQKEEVIKDLKLFKKTLGTLKKEINNNDFTPYTPRRKEEEEFENKLNDFTKKFYHAYLNNKINLFNPQEIKNLAYYVFREDIRMFDEVKKINNYPDKMDFLSVFDIFQKLKITQSKMRLVLFIESIIIIVFGLAIYLSDSYKSELINGFFVVSTTALSLIATIKKK